MTTFSDLSLVGPLLRALEKQGFDTPTPIQGSAIPHLLEGRDLMGIAQTGGGKTAAFVLPLLQNLQHDRKRPKPNKPTAVILAPTRELASQIGKAIQIFTRGIKLFHTVVYGGAPYGPQLKQLKAGVDILVATPGRLMDHMDRGTVDLSNVQTFILDEADRMLDMGFVEDVQKISATLPEEHQTVMFSATMSPAIKRLSQSLLVDPEFVEAPRESVVANTIDHSVLMVERTHKKDLLMHLIGLEETEKVIVFVRTKATAETLTEEIEDTVEGVRTAAIHGDKQQRARERTLRSFKNDRFTVLVATDVAARGIDVSGITHVINYDLPMEAENYVHRVGRTGRAGASGTAISICEPRERNLLRNIEQLIKVQVRVDNDHPFPVPKEKPKKSKPKGRPFSKTKKPGFKGKSSAAKRRKNTEFNGRPEDHPRFEGKGRVEKKKKFTSEKSQKSTGKTRSSEKGAASKFHAKKRKQEGKSDTSGNTVKFAAKKHRFKKAS
ncbi:DEAD/DEAH box helicase [Sneathiella glossodoripedis]|uniref:DEAD/DEAH box helicase n=1 Tax=Sneathiella glossodoripedis TaxID=418853 RepID=UPI000471162E|nr:DEAD/DEAH box helicase [Sneathiella glossodoripedis]